MFALVWTCCRHGIENSFCSRLACKANSRSSSTTQIHCEAIVQDMLSRLGQLDFGWWHTFSPHPCVTRFAETICVKESKRFRYRESQASFGNCKRQHCRKASMLS